MDSSKNPVRDALAIQNEQLKSQLMATSLITEITKIMLASPEIDHVFRTMILGIHETLGFDRVILFLVDKEKFCLQPRSFVDFEDAQMKSLSIPLSFMGGSTADAVFLNKHIIVDIVDKDIDPIGVLDTSAYLVIPLMTKIVRSLQNIPDEKQGGVSGAFGVNPYDTFVFQNPDGSDSVTEDDRRKAFMKTDMFRCVGVLWMDKPGAETLVTSDQMTTLTTLAYQAGLVIDNFEMYQAVEKANRNLKEINVRIAQVNDDLSRANAKINKDLDQARVIQTGLLPSEFSNTGHIRVGARYIPANQVGGDYYDFFRINDNSLGLIVADVSGHGVAAAMVMAMTKVLLKTFSSQIPSPQKILEKINHIFQTEIRTDNFVTIFYAHIHTDEKKIRFVSAGHNPIIFLNKATGAYDLIKADGLFLGVFEDMMLCESGRTYQAGDRIVLYTDGLTEAENEAGEMFSMERLCEMSVAHREKSPDDFIDYILTDLKTFVGRKTFEDDVTMLVIDF